jgi:hypothetical protein
MNSNQIALEAGISHSPLRAVLALVLTRTTLVAAVGLALGGYLVTNQIAGLQ